MDEVVEENNQPEEIEEELDLRSDLPDVSYGKPRTPVSSATIILALISLFLLGLLGYLFVANLAFMGYLPKRVAYKLPFIAGTVQKIAAQERRIAWAKERIADRQNIKRIGQFDLEIREESDLEGAEQAPPFLYKFRVIRNKVKGKEFAELWVDNVQTMRMLIGQGTKSPYARAKQVAQRLYDAVNAKADFNLLLPSISSGNYSAVMDGKEMFQVSREDAIGQNTMPRHLLYQWINATRVAMGAPAIEEPGPLEGGDFPAASFLNPGVPKVATASAIPTSSATATASVQSTSNAEAEAKRKLRQLALVYEKMDIEALPPIFARMNNKAAEDIMLVLSDRLLAKLFVALPPPKVATYYKELTRGTLTDEPEKNYKRFIRVWEKVPPDDTIVIWKFLSVPECKRIMDRMAVKKKSKLLSTMQSSDAALYLKLMRDN